MSFIRLAQWKCNLNNFIIGAGAAGGVRLPWEKAEG